MTLVHLFRRRGHDEPRALFAQLVRVPQELLAHLRIDDLAGNPQKIRLRKIDERLSDKGEVAGHLGALGPARRLDDLHEDLVSPL